METDEELVYKFTPLQRRSVHRFWTTEETEFLLGMYEKNLRNIGPDKAFRSKLHLWNEIALRLNKAFQLQRTTIQCISRFKALQRTTLSETNSVKTTESADTMTSSAEDDDDDGMDTVGAEIINEDAQSKIADVIRSTLLEIHELKEEAKERRHRERMQLLEQFLHQDAAIENVIIMKEPAAVRNQQSVNNTEMMRQRLLQMQRKKMEDRERKQRVSMAQKQQKRKSVERQHFDLVIVQKADNRQ